MAALGAVPPRYADMKITARSVSAVAVACLLLPLVACTGGDASEADAGRPDIFGADTGDTAGSGEGTAVDSGAGDMIVDLSELEMIDAAGLGVLVGTHRRALRAERRLVLRDVPPRVMRMLAITRLHRVLRVELTPAAVA